MSKKFLSFFLASAVTGASAQTKWAYDLSHAKIGFSISHFGISETAGKFTRFDGAVLASRPDFSDAQIDLKIEVASINTDDAKRDEHLRSPDFFNSAQFPLITFKSKSLKPLGSNRYELLGDLSMHGVTREITLIAEYKGTVVDPFNNTKAGFKVNGSLDRTAWGLTWNGTLAAGGLLVGNDVHLDINLELTMVK